MTRLTTLAALSALVVALSSPAFPASGPTAIQIDAGPLRDSLQALALQTGIELLFDSSAVVGLGAPDVEGHLTVDAALQRLLSDSGLNFRRAKSGAWIVERPAAPALTQPDAAVAEILVVGRRTLNADIQRFENDVQPYQVTTRTELVRSHRDNLEQFFASRITSNTQVVPVGLTQTGNPTSQIDLRGLGTRNTLVLVDGRRMPGIPDLGSGFQQADLNGIPLHAIERIEVLTGAAGGIYGFGALGGVVNIVLDRDSRGLDLYVNGGVSARGDAGRRSVEANYGFTSRDGRTDFTAFGSWSEADQLLAGERRYSERDRRAVAAHAPQFFLLWTATGNSVGVFSHDPSFELKPEFGGSVLGSDHTFLPSGFSGSTADLAASLEQHAGQLDSSLADGDARRDLGSNPRSDSWLFNVRHRFGERLEAYGDVMVLETDGHSTNHSSNGVAYLSPDSPANPFMNFVDVTFPISGTEKRDAIHVESTRYMTGLLAQLPFGWRGTLEGSTGAFRNDSSTSALGSTRDFLELLGDRSDLDTNPFGDWRTFQSALIEHPSRSAGSLTQRNSFADASLRLAGPVFATAAGPATLTLLAEHRREHVRQATETGRFEVDGTTSDFTWTYPSRLSATSSLYAELRTQLFAPDTPIALLRGLDLQLAVRRDDQRNEFVEDPAAIGLGAVNVLHPRFAGTAFTAGGRITPWHWLMLRGSYATGTQPPPPDSLREFSNETLNHLNTGDPKRGNRDLGDDGPFLLEATGNHDLRTVRASTMFLGTVLTPFGEDGLTIAVDYSRIRKTRDVLALLPGVVMEHEDFWPERVVRGPLTDADRALGYRAGPVTMLDTRNINGAGLAVDAYDLRADWPLSLFGGRLRLYSDATWHKSNRSTALFQPDVENAGFLDGPLKWRANGGFDWSANRLSVGANLQYYGDYRVYHDGTLQPASDPHVIAQGAPRIPSQTYVDAQASWRIPLRDGAIAEEITADFGIVNVFDAAPPRETSLLFFGPGYSRYGDPRQRRFELTLSAHF